LEKKATGEGENRGIAWARRSAVAAVAHRWQRRGIGRKKSKLRKKKKVR
jgi:hypothetical protein